VRLPKSDADAGDERSFLASGMKSASRVTGAPVDVVIVNFNARDHLRACLASVEREAPNKPVVVDTSSTDGSAEMVAAEYGWARLVRCRNRGYGAAANRGVTETSADYVLLLNSDTVLASGSLRALSDYLDAHADAGLAGPRLINPDGSLQPSCYEFLTPLKALVAMTLLNQWMGHVPGLREHYLPTSSHDRARLVPWLKGAALAIRREAFEAIGGFDESYFMYFEELDLSYRLQAAGWEVHFTPTATVVHAGGASTGLQRAAMTVQLFASLRRFYEHHYSTARIIELRFLLAAIMAARLIRDGIRLRRTSNTVHRSALEEDISAWRQTLRLSFASWSRRRPRLSP
jgi:N-acetylglucosaminyl-diphospho-decaprenol L-rhamnosyltransferase